MIRPDDHQERPASYSAARVARELGMTTPEFRYWLVQVNKRLLAQGRPAVVATRARRRPRFTPDQVAQVRALLDEFDDGFATTGPPPLVDDGIIDLVAVAITVEGRRRVRLTTRERKKAVAQMRDLGYPQACMATHLGVSLTVVQRLLAALEHDAHAQEQPEVDRAA